MLIDILLTSLFMFNVTRHGQSFKTPPAYETCTREASAAPAAQSLPVIHPKLEKQAPHGGLSIRLSGRDACHPARVLFWIAR